MMTSSIVGKYDVTRYTGRITTQQEEDHATATGNVRRKFDKVWTSESRDICVNRKTGRLTDRERHTLQSPQQNINNNTGFLFYL